MISCFSVTVINRWKCVKSETKSLQVLVLEPQLFGSFHNWLIKVECQEIADKNAEQLVLLIHIVLFLFLKHVCMDNHVPQQFSNPFIFQEWRENEQKLGKKYVKKNECIYLLESFELFKYCFFL